MPRKTCVRGGIERDITEYHRDKSKPDGLHTYCKPCRKVLSAEHRKANRPRLLAQEKAYRDTHKEQAKATQREWRKKNRKKWGEYSKAWFHRNPEYSQQQNKRLRKERPDKYAAYNAVAIAKRSGALVKPDACPKCGASDRRIEAHHSDYNKPLDIEWLCSGCHRQAHMGDSK